ncbi:MAG: murein biosynthesis integral membrane protein MurJ [Phycisphaerae bacterium]|nr:murein biosynthesis integral membrane protein MurJ [Phycisphaerae bacterium]
MNENSDTTRTDHVEREKFFAAAKVVAALTMLSRILGLVRDMLLVPLGADVLADRFWVAFSVPNLFRRLFGEGALSAAFVPVFTEVAEAEGWDRARVVLANVAGLLALLLSVLVMLTILCLWATWEIWGGDDSQLFLLQLTALMMPFMITICLLALGSAALNCRGHFAYPAAAPIILNIGLIVGAKWIAPAVTDQPREQFVVVALSLLAAGLAQAIGVVWLLHRAKLAAMATIRPILPETKRIAKLMAPMMIPLSVLQFSAFADRLIALLFTAPEHAPGTAPLAHGAVRCLYAAARLYMLPMGVLALPIATVIFPLLGRYAARDDHQGLRDTTNRALRLCLFLSIPAGVGLILLAKPAIAIIYQRQDFSEAHTVRTAAMLQMYCLGMWAFFCNQILLRAFLAIKKPREPLLIACSLVVVNLAMVIVGIHTPLKGAAVGLATAITASLNTLLLVWFLRRRWGQIGLRRILESLVRIILATAAMAGVIWAGMVHLPGPLENWLRQAGLGWAVPIAVIAALVVAGAGVYLAITLALRCPELKELRKKSVE